MFAFVVLQFSTSPHSRRAAVKILVGVVGYTSSFRFWV